MRVNRFFALNFFALLVGMGMRGVMAIDSSRPVPFTTVSPAVQAVSPNARPTLLADEINRRLSRLGISFNRVRLPHPYDPVGEVC